MSETQVTEENSEAEDEDPNTDETPEDEEYVGATLYLRESLKDEYDRWLRLKEVENPEVVLDAERRQAHEAIISVAMNSDEEFLKTLKKIKEGEEPTSNNDW